MGLPDGEKSFMIGLAV